MDSLNKLTTIKQLQDGLVEILTDHSSSLCNEKTEEEENGEKESHAAAYYMIW